MAAGFGNVGTMIIFRVGSFDAEVLEKEFAPVFTAEDIVNLGLYQVYLKLMIDQVASQPFSAVTTPPIPKPEVSFREKALEMSRKNYAQPKAEVEKAIEEWHAPERSSQIRNPKSEIRNEKIEIKKPEIKYEPPKPKFEPPKQKENYLAKAIEQAVKEKPPAFAKSFGVAKEEIKPEQKKEAVSLQELRHGEKNKNKEATPENKNALKEAISKAASSQQPVVREEIKKEEKVKEVPEETLRKILKGE